MGFTDTESTTTTDSSTTDPEDPSEEELTEKVHQLILEQTNLTEDNLDQQVKNRINEYDGLVGETAALYLIAKDHGIQPNQELGVEEEDPELEIENVVPDINDLQITVKVDKIQEVNTFEKKGETKRVRNVVVRDQNDDRTQLTLWSSNVEIADQLQPNDTLRIESGYTKESDWCKKRYDCPAELRIGNNGKLYRVEDNGEELLIEG